MEDPWTSVSDLDGQQHYRILGIKQDASNGEIRHAYRVRARQLHPDKGGDAASFARLRDAFEVLVDPSKRAVYDRWSRDVQYRYIPGNAQSFSTARGGMAGVTRRFPGGEDELLKQYERNGIYCDAATQLVVTCEVCRRPATKECWTCKMQICDFCTLKQHWKDTHPLHWPLINSKAFRARLAKSEMEKKIQEDAKKCFLQDPNYRNQHELKVIRSFKLAAEEIYCREDYPTRYDNRLAKFYMWAQTEDLILLAVHVPTGYADRAMRVECAAGRLLVQSEGSQPVIERRLDLPLAPGEMEAYASIDNRFHVLFLKKQNPGDTYRQLFLGDSDGSRCFEPIYDLCDVEDEVLLEVKVPFWIDQDDVDVHFTERQVEISVRNQLHIQRSFWTEIETVFSQRKETTPAIDVQRCSWCLEEETVNRGEREKILSVSFVRPDPTASELEWKKGVRQDNKVQRLGGRPASGVRFFADDEDEFRLEDILQAACIKVVSQTFVPARAWEERSAFRARRLAELSLEVQQCYKDLFLH